jgi:non-specific serine/threonine protein kinase
MALPYLVKHIYNSGTEEVIRRGKKIHALGNAELLEYDDLMATVVFRVKDDGYATFYKVHITQFKDPKTLSLRCSCPYNLSEICRHKAGALFHLQDLLDKNLLGDKETIYDQKHTVVKMKQLDLKLIRLLTKKENFEAAENFLRSNRASILEAKEERVLAEIEYEDLVHKVLIQKTKNEILIQVAPVIAIQSIRYVCTRVLYYFSYYKIMVLIILTAYVIGIKKKTNSWPCMVIH